MLSKPLKKCTTIQSLFTQKGQYNFDTIYQRGEAWPKQYKEDLIQTILIEQMDISPIVLHDNGAVGLNYRYNIIDGKQRLKAIVDFIDNKFLISYKNKKYSYKKLNDIKNDKTHKEHVNINNLLDDFYNYSLNMTVYKDLNIYEQYRVFEKVNHSTSLNPSEVLFSEFFHCKRLMIWIKKEFPNIYENMGFSFVSRSKDISFMLRLYSGLAGTNVDKPKLDILQMVEDRKDTYKFFVEKLNEKILNTISKIDDDEIFTRDKNHESMKLFIKEMNLSDVISSLEFIEYLCKNDLLSLKGDSGKQKIWATMYLAMFYCIKHNEKIITRQFIEFCLDDFRNIKKQYLEYLNDEKDVEIKNQRIMLSINRMKIFSDIDNIFKKNIKDLSPKLLIISEKDRKKVFDIKDKKCAICKATKDLQIDHKAPKGTTSNMTYDILCGKCNRKKSNSTAEDCKKIADYINS